MSKNKSTSLSWDDFQALGNPDNPDLNSDTQESEHQDSNQGDYNHFMQVRIWLDKKNRKGKKATIIKGLDHDDEELNSLCKVLKTKCGVGGSAKNGEIIIQGDQRNKILEILTELGYSKAKLAGG